MTLSDWFAKTERGIKMSMPRHMKVVRFLDAEIEQIQAELEAGESEDFNKYDLLLQTRRELQHLKEENALYRSNFQSFGKAFVGE